MRKSHCQCHLLTVEPHSDPVERALMARMPHFDIVKTIDCEACVKYGNPGAVPVGTGPLEQWAWCSRCRGTAKTTVLYLRRFYLWRSSWIGKNFGELYLHKIHRSDDDREPHDHPWNFRTVVLSGGYTDEAWWWQSFDDQNREGYRVRVPAADEVLTRFSTRRRDRDHVHRVRLTDDKPAWTLVWTSGYRNDANGDADWGFFTADERIPWREYLKLDKKEEYGG